MYGVGAVMSLVMLAFVLISSLIMNHYNKDNANMGRSLW